MFLAIINDTYAVVKAESLSKKADFQMSDFFKTGVNNVRGSMGIQDRYIDADDLKFGIRMQKYTISFTITVK